MREGGRELTGWSNSHPRVRLVREGGRVSIGLLNVSPVVRWVRVRGSTYEK